MRSKHKFEEQALITGAWETCAKCELEEDGSKHGLKEHGEQVRIPGAWRADRQARVYRHVDPKVESNQILDSQCRCRCQGHEISNYSESERTARDRGKSTLAHALGTDRVRFWVADRVRF